ncbi:MAG: hypothetical protein JSR33_06735, partial [Proteobacteria bacterium]|nr:hypothetical protein [Pseudomonadota bacterium]
MSKDSKHVLVNSLDLKNLSWDKLKNLFSEQRFDFPNLKNISLEMAARIEESKNNFSLEDITTEIEHYKEIIDREVWHGDTYHVDTSKEPYILKSQVTDIELILLNALMSKLQKPTLAYFLNQRRLLPRRSRILKKRIGGLFAAVLKEEQLTIKTFLKKSWKNIKGRETLVQAACNCLIEKLSESKVELQDLAKVYQLYFVNDDIKSIVLKKVEEEVAGGSSHELLTALELFAYVNDDASFCIVKALVEGPDHENLIDFLSNSDNLKKFENCIPNELRFFNYLLDHQAFLSPLLTENLLIRMLKFSELRKRIFSQPTLKGKLKIATMEKLAFERPFLRKNLLEEFKLSGKTIAEMFNPKYRLEEVSEILLSQHFLTEEVSFPAWKTLFDTCKTHTKVRIIAKWADSADEIRSQSIIKICNSIGKDNLYALCLTHNWFATWMIPFPSGTEELFPPHERAKFELINHFHNEIKQTEDQVKFSRYDVITLMRLLHNLEHDLYYVSPTTSSINYISHSFSHFYQSLSPKGESLLSGLKP